MATASSQPEQKNVIVNPAISTVFFQSQSLAYNYKTKQWSHLTQVDGYRFFPVYGSDKVLGIVEPRTSGITWAIYDSASTGSGDLGVIMKTGALEVNPNSFATVDWSRPVADADAIEPVFPRIGVRNTKTGTENVVYASSAESRTGRHYYRGSSNTVPPTGRYFTFEVRYGDQASATLTSFRGLEVSYTEAGES